MDFFRSRLESKVGAAIDERLRGLATGLDEREYRIACGEIQGMRRVLILCEEVELEMDRGSK